MTRRELIQQGFATLVSTSLPIWQAQSNEVWEQARQRALRANAAFRKCHQFLQDVRKRKADGCSLYFFSGDSIWLVQDAAADVLPFVVVAAHFLDPAFAFALRDTLRDEKRLTNDAKGIPQTFNLKNHAIVAQSRSQVIFGASEYCKDGLAPMVEVLGKGEWFERMRQIMDALHDEIGQTTDYGLGAVQTDEVNGNLLQVLVRLFGMTQDAKYLRWAERIADDFLLKRNWKPTVLSDHGCEIISGLAMLYGLTSVVDKPKAAEYQPRIRAMLDYVLERGTDADGLLFRSIGQSANDPVRTDNWGYNYIALVLYDMIASHPSYRAAVEKVLRNLPKYKGFPWGGGRSGRFTYLDELADSVEGGIYLINRVPLPEGKEWIEAEMQTLMSMDYPVHKFGANSVRTTMQYAFMQTEGVYLREWLPDVRVGAVRNGKTLRVLVEADKNWSGKLCFDFPRYRELIGLPIDLPRINSFPEQFVVERDARYTVEGVSKNPLRISGKQLRDGLPLALKAGQSLRITVKL